MKVANLSFMTRPIHVETKIAFILEIERFVVVRAQIVIRGMNDR